MSFQSQPSISSFFRQLTPQEREARSAIADHKADQKARAEGSAKRPLVAPIPTALQRGGVGRQAQASRKFPWCSHSSFNSMPGSHQQEPQHQQQFQQMQL